MKKIFSILLVFVLLIFAGCGKSDVYVTTNRVYEYDNYAGRVGIADYLFVAKIIELTDTFEVGDRLYTIFKAKVLKNIKGELIQDNYIHVIVWGGIYSDDRRYFVDGDSIGPEDVGNIYTVLALGIGKSMMYDVKGNETGFKRGSLYADYMDPTFVDIDIEKDTQKQIDEKLEKDETYQKYKKGYENEIPYPYDGDWERVKSIYDVNYKE